MDPTCHRCEQPTWVIWEKRPWCREHFLAEQTARRPCHDNGVDDQQPTVTTAGTART